VDTMNVGSRAPTCPLFIVALREKELTAIHNSRPRSERELDRFSDPEITFLTLYTISSHCTSWFRSTEPLFGSELCS
jgi:hypothetical protein